MRTKSVAVVAVSLCLLTMPGGTPSMAEDKSKLSAADFEQIAEEAYIYGFPMVMGYGILYEYAVNDKSDQYKAPFNQIANMARLFTPKDTAVIMPNSDTPYSSIWGDLRAEPLVLRVPAVEKSRYYGVQLIDLYTFNYGYIGSRTTGNGTGTYLLAGPSWKGEKPQNVQKVFRCETDFSLLVFRTQLFGPSDLDNVKKVQAGYKVQPLSAFLGKPAPPAASKISWPKFDKESAQVNPFAYLSFLLQFCPPVGAGKVEKPLRARFAKIGIEAGKPFPLDKLTAKQKASLAAGIKNGLAKIKKGVAGIGKDENGWRVGAVFGDRAFYHGDWTLRAAAAMAGIYGNNQAEALYPLLVADSDGNKPNCRRNRYALTFAKGQLPPVNAFWSVTAYDAATQLLIDNPINRYLINSSMLPDLKKNEDGSLTLYLQKDSPGKDKETNWLPTPDGPFILVMRLYWPKNKALDNSWKPPPLRWIGPARKPLGVVRFGDRPYDNIVRTDERYGHNGLFQGPRGWGYWKYLEHPKPIQNPNLWTDTKSTYFLSRFAMPAGSTLTFHGKYPYARYHKFALYKAERDTFVSINEDLMAQEIEPDPGSTNPFRVGANRLAERRDFTLRIVASDAPANAKDRVKNTLYAGHNGGELELVVRIYLADQDWDGAGWGPAASPFTGTGLPTYEGTLRDGTKLSAAEVVKRFARPFTRATESPLTAEQWVQLVHARNNDPTLNPATAPARTPPRWEKFWTLRYSVAGAFKSPQERAKIPFAGAMEGGGDGPYLVTFLSRRLGPVCVMRGKMPTFPNTYAGNAGRGLATMPDAQTQYWSVVSCEAAPSGWVVDGLSDFQVPLDANRRYTIVVSRREDRPKNATRQNGVAWLEWSPRGEGLDHPRNRTDFGMLIMRIMANNPKWKNSPDHIKKPGDAEAVMGPYYPRGEYTTKASFEAKGPKKK